MGNLWLKIKIWTKITIIGLLVLYVLAFTLKNTGQQAVKIWFWFGHDVELQPLLLGFVMFLLGIVAAILTQTLITTIKQVRELKSRNRSEKLERDIAEMKMKASMLKTRPDARAVEVKTETSQSDADTP
jgi:uncharacterized integral membrane protein